VQARLVELGTFYGSMPAHDGLWESAAATAHSLAARLAVESCVHEARGLDVLPQASILHFNKHAPYIVIYCRLSVLKGPLNYIPQATE
jgi:uncharacterized ferritin-like protein (DUF455 family)